MRSLSLGGLVLVLAAAAGVWWIAHTDQLDAERPPEPVALRVTDATIVLRHQGAKQAEITADRVEVSADRQVTTFTGRTRAVFFEGDAPSLTLTGGRIIYDRTRQAVRVEGGLSITTARGETLRAQAGTWDQESEAVELFGEVEAVFPLVRQP